MTTFADFQTYYLRKVWRTGDAELTGDLPLLVKEAESRIRRDLRDQKLATTANVVATTGSFFELPADFQELISGTVNGKRLTMAVPMQDLYRSARDQEDDMTGPFYSVLGNRLFVRGRVSLIPAVADITYFMGITPYADVAGASVPFYDAHPDFYIAALNVFVYDYLREFELKQQNEAAYGELLDSMIRNSNYARFPSGMTGSALISSPW